MIYEAAVLSLKVLGICLVVGLVATYLYYKALPKPIPGIPHNEEATTTVFGDFPSFQRWHAQRPELYTWVTSQVVKLNSPIIQLFMRPLGKPWIVVADYSTADDVMTRRTKEFDRADVVRDFFAPILPEWHTHMKSNETWRSHRKLVGDAMSPGFLKQVAPGIYKNAVEIARLWREKARLASGRRAGLDMIWNVAFGNHIGATRSQIEVLASLTTQDLNATTDTFVRFPKAPTSLTFDSIVTLTRSVEIALSSPFPGPHLWLALRCLPRLRSARERKDALIKESLKESWRKFSEDEKGEDSIRSAADLFVQREVCMAKKEGRQPKYDTPAIRDELFGFLFAGHDTTSVTLSWAFKLLTAHQNVQNKLRSALRATFQDALKSGRMPCVQEIVSANIPYLDATIEEVHRVGGTVSANVRTALCDTQILGHFIPKGTDVFLLCQGPSYTLPPIRSNSHGTSSTFAFESKRGTWESASIGDFVPERWISNTVEHNGQFNLAAGPSHPSGAGPRGCFGRRLAAMELKIMLAIIMWEFVLEPTPLELSSFVGHDVNTHVPQQCYLRLAKA